MVVDPGVDTSLVLDPIEVELPVRMTPFSACPVPGARSPASWPDVNPSMTTESFVRVVSVVVATPASLKFELLASGAICFTP